MPFRKPDREVSRVFLHCSASDRPEHDDIAVMRRWHLARGWNDVGYHYFIRKTGRLEAGRDIERTPAAQGGNNTGTIAICLHGLEKAQFKKNQFRKLIKLCSEIREAYVPDGGVTFHGHNEVANKGCPVFDYKTVLGLGPGGLMEAGTNLEPDKVVAETAMPVLSVTASGPAVRQLQTRLVALRYRITIDGAFGQQTLNAVRKFQAKKGLTVDGVVGARTWEALAAG